MQTINEIRRARIKQLIDEIGSVKALAEKLERSPGQVSQWSNASIDSKSQKPRAISSQTARYIEKICGRPTGWMDMPSAAEPMVIAKLEAERIAASEDEKKLLRGFRQLDSEGGGRLRVLAFLADEIKRERGQQSDSDPNRQLLAGGGRKRTRII